MFLSEDSQVRTDALFCLLFQSAPSVLLALLGRSPDGDYTYEAVEVEAVEVEAVEVEAVEVEAVEVKEVAFRFDGVMRPAVETAEQPTIFVEVQFQLDIYFYHRFFAEIFLFLRKNPGVQHWQASFCLSSTAERRRISSRFVRC